jgi:hypothetical protein
MVSAGLPAQPAFLFVVFARLSPNVSFTQAQLQNESATKIQALYRGHSVRLNLALGHALSSFDGFTAGREVST